MATKSSAGGIAIRTAKTADLNLLCGRGGSIGKARTIATAAGTAINHRVNGTNARIWFEVTSRELSATNSRRAETTSDRTTKGRGAASQIAGIAKACISSIVLEGSAMADSTAGTGFTFSSRNVFGFSGDFRIFRGGNDVLRTNEEHNFTTLLTSQTKNLNNN